MRCSFNQLEQCAVYTNQNVLYNFFSMLEIILGKIIFEKHMQQLWWTISSANKDMFAS